MDWAIFVSILCVSTWIIWTVDKADNRILKRVDELESRLAEIEKKLDKLNIKEERPTVSEATWRNWEKGAERGDPEAQFSFGLHQSIAGLKPEAASWYKKAAEQGHAYAQHYLGMAYANSYHNSDGVPQSDTEAYFWLNLSATSWDKAKEGRDALAKRITAEQRTELDERCREWIESHPKIFR